MTSVPQPTPREQGQATIIAMAVRNALESLHGGDVADSLTDDQMARINPLVRDAVLSTLHALDHADRHPAARSWLAFQAALVPPYWEEPQLLADYVEGYRRTPAVDLACGNCSRPVYLDASGRWTHAPHADGATYRGCRAASFSEGGWDESLSRSLKARAPRD